MIQNKKITAIILVAGNSIRFGQNKNKNFELINNKPVLLYSFEAFYYNKYIDNIIIAVRKSEIDDVNKILNIKECKKEIKIVIGGNTRKESVLNCLFEADSEIVIIQDGARPMIKQEYINNCIESMNDFDGATIGVKSKDTVKIIDENNKIIYSTNRENTWLTQTPQCFKRDILFEMHQKYKNNEVTDDCQLLEIDGYKVKMIEGDYSNIKITTYDDLQYIKSLIK